MPKYYEPDNFEDSYRNFLKEKIGIGSNSSKNIKSTYIDPDSVDGVGKTDFYNDLTKFLNKREENCIKGERYLYLPPLMAPKIQEQLKITENYKVLSDLRKITVMGKGDECRLFRLTSDQFGFSADDNIYENPEDKSYPLPNLLYSYQNNSEAEQKKIIDRITEYVKNTRTIGGSFLWPVYKAGRKDYYCYYNIGRGVRNYLEDRVDLTLLEIKHALDTKYENKEYESDILNKQYNNANTYMENWLDHFGTFKTYVKYFMLEPFCEKVPANNGKENEKDYEKYDYVPINIIDGELINEENIKDYCKSGRENYAVRNLGKKDIINMLDRLEGMILVRTVNMERVIESYREK